ncbi:MAG: hypothetical protein EBR09_12070 [Proteobacteria bacterium]|nr:hypothetical protein [Pseudomonadota bacterium]
MPAAKGPGRRGARQRRTRPGARAADGAAQSRGGDALGLEAHGFADAELTLGAGRQRRGGRACLALDDADRGLRVAGGAARAARVRRVERSLQRPALGKGEFREHAAAGVGERRVLRQRRAHHTRGARVLRAELQREREVGGEGLGGRGPGRQRADARQAPHVAGAPGGAACGRRRGGAPARREGRRVRALPGERGGALRSAAPQAYGEGRQAAVDNARAVDSGEHRLARCGGPRRARRPRHAGARAARQRKLVRAARDARVGGGRVQHRGVRGTHARVLVRHAPVGTRRARAVADRGLHAVHRTRDAQLLDEEPAGRAAAGVRAGGHAGGLAGGPARARVAREASGTHGAAREARAPGDGRRRAERTRCARGGARGREAPRGAERAGARALCREASCRASDARARVRGRGEAAGRARAAGARARVGVAPRRARAARARERAAFAVREGAGCTERAGARARRLRKAPRGAERAGARARARGVRARQALAARGDAGARSVRAGRARGAAGGGFGCGIGASTALGAYRGARNRCVLSAWTVGACFPHIGAITCRVRVLARHAGSTCLIGCESVDFDFSNVHEVCDALLKKQVSAG